MCLAIPVKINKIVGNKKAIIESGEKVDISLLPKIKKGDWVFVQSGFAVKKISKKEAMKNISLFKKIANI
jgi:hydrogenase assembly chaperone HypC/HupF